MNLNAGHALFVRNELIEDQRMKQVQPKDRKRGFGVVTTTNGNVGWIANYIWGIAADVLRDLYVRGKYRDVILRPGDAHREAHVPGNQL